MPTEHKAARDDKPIRLKAAATAHKGHVKKHLRNLVGLMKGTTKRVPKDEFEPIQVDILNMLFLFHLFCIEDDILSPNRKVAIYKEIHRDPIDFIRDNRGYNERALDVFFKAYSNLSDEHREQIQLFARGRGRLQPDAVKAAAKKAIDAARPRGRQKKGGRLKDGCLEEFAKRTARLFESGGGTLTATQGGPFWKFVEILRGAVIEQALKNGSVLTVETIVRTAVRIKKDRIEIDRLRNLTASTFVPHETLSQRLWQSSDTQFLPWTPAKFAHYLRGTQSNNGVCHEKSYQSRTLSEARGNPASRSENASDSEALGAAGCP